MKLNGRGYLILIGLWHLASYAPALLARQFCDKQGDPHITSCNFLQAYNREEHWPLVAGVIKEWQNGLVMGKSGKGVTSPLSIYYHWRDSQGTGKWEAPTGWFSDKKEERKQSVEVLGKKSVMQIQEQTILQMSQQIETLQLESSEWKRKWEEAERHNLELAKRLVVQNKMVDSLHKELGQARQNVKKLKEKGKQERAKVEAHALKTIAKLEAELKGARSSHVRKIKKWKEECEMVKNQAEGWKHVAQVEADSRTVVREELMKMVMKYNTLADDYKMKGGMMLQKGEELMWKVNEAQRQLENVAVAELAKGNVDIADQLKQTYWLLASCKGESSNARIEGPLPEVSTSIAQALVPAQSQPGDPMTEDDSILFKINEEPGDFEEM